MKITAYNLHDGSSGPSLGLCKAQVYSALGWSRRCYEIKRSASEYERESKDPGAAGCDNPDTGNSTEVACGDILPELGALKEKVWGELPKSGLAG
jgi:hypothetical protein